VAHFILPPENGIKIPGRNAFFNNEAYDADMQIIAGSGAPKLGRDIAARMNSEVVEFETRRFPDGERYVKLNNDCRGKTVGIIQSTYKDPDELLMEFVMLADAAHGAGAAKVIGIFPYLAYLRQDARFHRGEALSSRVFARMIRSSDISRLVAVDPHLHRIHDLNQLFHIPTTNLSAMPDMAAYVSQHFRLTDPIVVAPDEEASQWASKVASELEVEYTIAKKVRLGDASVNISFEGPRMHARDVLIVDDIVSTGGTVAKMAIGLKKLEVGRIVVLVTHGLFTPGAYHRIRTSGVDDVVATDSVPNEYSFVSVAPLIAKSLLL
jgi:ribose-phosphate pyrophosphokinase